MTRKSGDKGEQSGQNPYNFLLVCVYKKEFIGKTPDYSPNSPKLKIGGKNYARNHFA